MTLATKHAGRTLLAKLQQLLDAATASPARKVGLALVLVLVAMLAIGLPGRLSRRRVRVRARKSDADERRSTAPLFAAALMVHLYKLLTARDPWRRAPAMARTA